MNLYKSIALSLIGAVSWTALSANSADDGIVELAKMDIRWEAPPSLISPDIESARQSLTLKPGGVGLIDSESYLRGRASTLADTFAFAPGIFAQSRFGSDEARISIRGSGLQRTFHGRGIVLMQDGIPLNLADGGFDFQSIEPLAVSHINVWRGGNAIGYGASTLGGAIDYVTPTGRTSGYRARLEVGSFDYVRAGVAVGAYHGKLDAFAAVSHQSQEGFRAHSEQSNQRIFANIGWQHSDNWESRFYLTAVKTDSELPGNLTKAQLKDNPRQANQSNIDSDQKRDFELYKAAFKSTYVVGETEWSTAAAWSYKDLDHPIFQVIDQKSNDATLHLSMVHNGELFAKANTIRAGILYTHGVTDAANFLNNLGNRGALVSKAEQTATNLSAYVENTLSLGEGLDVVAALAASTNKRDNKQLFGGNASSTYDLNYQRLMPKIGIIKRVGEVAYFANISTSYEPPSFSETFTQNKAREAQRAVSGEIGSRGTKSFLKWDATLYYAKLKNELLTITDPVTTQVSTINANDTLHYGAEVLLEADLLGGDWLESPDNRLVARANWLWGEFVFDNDPAYGDNAIAGVPPHVVRFELVWEHAAGWYAGPVVEWVPEGGYIDHRNTFKSDSYATLGFRLGKRTDSGLSWFVEGKNLTDKHYAATTGVIEDAKSTDTAQFLPGEVLSVFGGVEYRW